MRSQVVVEMLRLELEASSDLRQRYLSGEWQWEQEVLEAGRRADGGGSPEKGNTVLTKTVSDR